MPSSFYIYSSTQSSRCDHILHDKDMFLRPKTPGSTSLLLGILLLVQTLVYAVPLDENSLFTPKLAARDDYPSDYPYPHKDECAQKVKTEENKSLFYTGFGGFGLTPKQLRDYKKQTGLHIVGDGFTYPSGFDAPKSEPKNDIPKQDEYYKRFVDEFSEAFSEACSGEVFLLLDFNVDANNPPSGQCRTTWYRKEYPALKNNGKVTKITQVNPADFTQTKQIWPTTAGSRLFRRDDDECLDYDQGKAPDLKAPPTGDEDDSSTGGDPTPPAPAPTSAPTSAPAPEPADYAKGTCSFHLDEWETCADDSSNLFAQITLYDNDKAVIGQTVVDPGSVGDSVSQKTHG